MAGLVDGHQGRPPPARIDEDRSPPPQLQGNNDETGTARDMRRHGLQDSSRPSFSYVDEVARIRIARRAEVQEAAKVACLCTACWLYILRSSTGDSKYHWPLMLL